MSTLLLSRVANACFWLSRYRERAEFTARIVDVNLHTLLDTSRLNGNLEADWQPILQINGCDSLFSGTDGRALNFPGVLHCLCLDATNSNSILACIRLARENARQAREQISSEMWEQINHMYHQVNRLTEVDLLDHSHEILQDIKSGALLLQGLADQTMMHGEGWHFIQLGRYIERANTTCRLLAVRSDPHHAQGEHYRDALHWIAVLKSASSLEAYHKTYTAPVSASVAIEFLLLDADLPRSILFCLESVLKSLTYISGRTGRRFGNEAERIAGQLASRLHYLRPEDIDLKSHLVEMQNGLSVISASITQTYFAYEVA
jgi:uncharacterized alpha-E superfamily protein